MPRLLHHHDRLLARPDRRHLRRLLDRAVPADGRQGATDGGVLVQAEMRNGMRVLGKERKDRKEVLMVVLEGGGSWWKGGCLQHGSRTEKSDGEAG